jgi:DNA-binding GntR family transcriptional regulator
MVGPARPRHRDIAREHRAILDAALAHDTDAATAAPVAHIQKTTNVLLEQADTDPSDTATA